jgi:hypothetical protein
MLRHAMLRLEGLSQRINPADFDWTGVGSLFSDNVNWVVHGTSTIPPAAPQNGDTVYVSGSSNIDFDVAWSGIWEEGTNSDGEGTYSGDVQIDQNVTFTWGSLYDHTVTIQNGKALTLGAGVGTLVTCYGTTFNELAGSGSPSPNAVDVAGSVLISHTLAVAGGGTTTNIPWTIESGAMLSFDNGVYSGGNLLTFNHGILTVTGTLQMSGGCLRTSDSDSYVYVDAGGEITETSLIGYVEMGVWCDSGEVLVTGASSQLYFDDAYSTTGYDLYMTDHYGSPTLRLSHGATIGAGDSGIYMRGGGVEFFYAEPITIYGDTTFVGCAINFRELGLVGDSDYPTEVTQDGSVNIALGGTGGGLMSATITLNMAENYDDYSGDNWAVTGSFDVGAGAGLTVVAVTNYLGHSGNVCIFSGSGSSGFDVSVPFPYTTVQDGNVVYVQL